MVVELGSLNLAISGGALIAGVLLAWLIGHGIAGPVGRLTAVMKALASGDIDLEIGNQDRGDEIGEMARAVSASSRPVRSMFGASRPRKNDEEERLKMNGAPRC